MRFLLQNKLSEESKVRIEYLYKVFRLWFVEKQQEKSFTEYVSIPENDTNILFIVGHNNSVKNFLESTTISEDTIVAITCDGNMHFETLKNKLKGKTFYMAKQERGYADQYKAEAFNMKFDPTESEIMLYNSSDKRSLNERLEKSFNKLF